MVAVLGVLPAAPAEMGTSVRKFQFGGGPARPGYTQVSATASYSKQTGYGFEPGVLLTEVGPNRGEARGRSAVTASQPFLFSVAMPEGNYHVTVVLGDPRAEAVTTVKAETRRLLLERVRTRPGKFERRTFAVNVRGPRISTGGEVRLDGREMNLATGEVVARHWDDKLTLAFGDAHPAVASVEIRKADGVVTLFLTGDSTVTDQARWPGSSWGQMVPRWFGPGVAVANHAESGETLRGFLRERRWEKVLDSVKRGDYVLIEFGTNDSKDRGPQNMYPHQDFAETYAPAETTYKELLRRFVADVRGKGAFPIIASPSARRDEVEKPTSLHAYATAAMEVARELRVPGIDLNSMGVALSVALGPEAGRQFGDRTHHVEYGSYLQAKCIVLGIRHSKLPLARFITDDFGRFDPTRPEPTASAFDLPVDPPPSGEAQPRQGRPSAADSASAARIGYCTSDLAKAKAIGFDFAEIGIRDLVKLSDEDFDQRVSALRATGLPTLAGYLFLPADLKVVGPDVDRPRVMAYVTKALERCERLGVRTIVFGAPDARRAPAGFPKEEAFAQLVRLGQEIAPLAARHGIVIAAEAIFAAQTNTINTTAEALAWMDAVGHPSFRFMVDLYQLVQQGEDPSVLRQARGRVAYAKIASPRLRGLPLPADGYDYGPYLSVLREIGYEGPLGMETTAADLDRDGASSIAFLRAAWPAPTAGVK